MMEIIFLLGWTGLFLTGLIFIWRKLLSRIRPYLMLVLSLVFLTGLFYLYELWVAGL